MNIVEFRTKLIDLLSADVQEGTISEYVIATNVRARRPGSPRVFDAVEMKFSDQKKLRPTYYSEYEAEDGGVHFFHLFAVKPDQQLDQ